MREITFFIWSSCLIAIVAHEIDLNKITDEAEYFEEIFRRVRASIGTKYGDPRRFLKEKGYTYDTCKRIVIRRDCNPVYEEVS